MLKVQSNKGIILNKKPFNYLFLGPISGFVFCFHNRFSDTVHHYRLFYDENNKEYYVGKILLFKRFLL